MLQISCRCGGSRMSSSFPVGKHRANTPKQTLKAPHTQDYESTSLPPGTSWRLTVPLDKSPPVNQELRTSSPLTDIQDTSKGICRAAVPNVWGGGRSEGGTRSETGFSTGGRWDAACGRRRLKGHSRGGHNLIHFKGADEVRSQFTRRRWSKVCEQPHTLAWPTGGGQSSAPIVLLLGLSRGSQAAKGYQSARRWLHRGRFTSSSWTSARGGSSPRGAMKGDTPVDTGVMGTFHQRQ